MAGHRIRHDSGGCMTLAYIRYLHNLDNVQAENPLSRRTRTVWFRVIQQLMNCCVFAQRCLQRLQWSTQELEKQAMVSF